MGFSHICAPFLKPATDARVSFESGAENRRCKFQTRFTYVIYSLDAQLALTACGKQLFWSEENAIITAAALAVVLPATADGRVGRQGSIGLVCITIRGKIIAVQQAEILLCRIMPIYLFPNFSKSCL